MLELLLDFARRASLDAAHEVADRDLGRDFDEHVDMIGRQDPADDRDVHFSADLLDDVAHPQADLPVQDLEPVFGCPDNVVTMVKDRVTAGAACHSLYPPTNGALNQLQARDGQIFLIHMPSAFLVSCPTTPSTTNPDLA